MHVPGNLASYCTYVNKLAKESHSWKAIKNGRMNLKAKTNPNLHIEKMRLQFLDTL